MKKRLLAALLLAVMVLTACNTTPATPTATTPPPTQSGIVGSIIAGDTSAAGAASGLTKKDLPSSSQDLEVLYSAEIETINYLWSMTTNVQQPGANCVSGMLENDEYGNIFKDLATDITRTTDGYVWTIKIREGVMWVDKNGNEICETTAEDFVAAASWYMLDSNISETANLVYDVIKNGRAVYDGSMPFEAFGIKAIDKYTVEYTLERPVPYFLSMMTYTIFYPACREYMETYGATVHNHKTPSEDRFCTSAETFANNGAYILQSFIPQVEHVFVANPKYYDAENVLVKRVKETYNTESSTIGPEMFLRGEVNSAAISTAILDAWMTDPAREAKVRPAWGMLYNYFFILNFWPNPDAMPAEYEPENWGLAVNNLAFRKSIFHALDRLQLAEIYEPYDPAAILTRTVTPPLFAAVDGKDYTDLGALGVIKNQDPFNVELALKYKEQAIEELTALGATFPVILHHPYQTPSREDTEKAVVLEQMLENILGADYINVVLEGAPATGFAANYRRAGNFGILISNWGADYLDPETFTDPLRPEEFISFNHTFYQTDCRDENGDHIYLKMVNEAQKELVDISKRYNLFAAAEAYLIDNCMAMPFRFTRSYVASSLIPFTGQWGNCGSATLKWKGRIYHETEFYNTAAFNDAYQLWLQERNYTISVYEDIFRVVPNK
ncbi:MAG: ABC transporter substrate-binding protein [Symbiobacteriaceae bacterium]|nr:ABC transporter substrate-binding protein [Symbiobacteriaceae bacterium]